MFLNGTDDAPRRLVIRFRPTHEGTHDVVILLDIERQDFTPKGTLDVVTCSQTIKQGHEFSALESSSLGNHGASIGQFESACQPEDRTARLEKDFGGSAGFRNPAPAHCRRDPGSRACGYTTEPRSKSTARPHALRSVDRRDKRARKGNKRLDLDGRITGQPGKEDSGAAIGEGRFGGQASARL